MTRIALLLARYQLKSRRPAVRLRALQKLRAALHSAVVSLDDSITIALLDHTLADTEPDIRREAAATLGDLRDPRTLPPLLRALRDRAEPVQEAAIQSLKRLDDRDAIEHLVPSLLHGSSTIQWRAAQTLKALGWRPNTSEEQIRYFIATGELERLATFGAEAVRPLTEIIQDTASEKRIAAVNVLGNINDPAVQKPLQTALRDTDPLVRTAAAYALAQASCTTAIPSILPALKDHERNVRLAAALALGKLGDPQCVPALIQLLNDRDWEVRGAALESLGKLGDARAFAPVTKHLEDADQDVRESAAGALARVGDETVVEKLVMTLVDAHSGVRQAAARALARIDPDWEKSERVRRLLPSIQASLKNKDASVQSAAAGLLRRVAGNNAPGLPPAPGQDEAEQKRHTITAILLTLLRDADFHLRYAAAEAIGQLHLTACANYLKPLQDDANESVRRAAHIALAALATAEPDAAKSKVTFLAATPAPAPTAASHAVVEDVLLCSAFGGALHETRCRDARGWRRLFNSITEHAQPLARSRTLGEFKRLEIETENSRILVLALAEGGVMVRIKTTSPDAPTATCAPATLAGETMKEQLTEWLRQTPSVRGVLMRGVRFADQTIVCDVDSRDITVTALEEVYRAVAETFQTLLNDKIPPMRLLWVCERAALHCVRRADGTILGAFATSKHGETDTAELHRQLGEFQSLVLT